MTIGGMDPHEGVNAEEAESSCLDVRVSRFVESFSRARADAHTPKSRSSSDEAGEHALRLLRCPWST